MEKPSNQKPGDTMSDGLFTVPIVADDGRVLGWGRGDCEVENANFHKCIGTPLRHLRVVDGKVEQISQAEKDALAAEDAARAEQQRLDDEQAALAALDQITGILPEGVTAEDLLRECRV
jgi:hypothetical protein